MEILDFKSISPFFELCRDGKKPFDVRLFDGKDARFRALAQFLFSGLRPEGWAIRFRNPATGERFDRKLEYCDWLRHSPWPATQREPVKPRWMIMYLGELVE